MDHPHLSASLVTLGDPGQTTGGYLYHRKVGERAARHEARLDVLSLPDRPFPLPALAVRRVLDGARGSDVLLVDSIAAAFLLPVLRHLEGRPLVAILHQQPGGIDRGGLRRSAQRMADLAVYRKASLLLAASQALADDLAARGFDRRRVRVVPPGRDLPESPASSRLDLRHGRRMSLLTIANWLPRKGILELLDAVAALGPDELTLHLVGDDKADRRYRRRVLARLQRPDLAGRVVVHGPVEPSRVATLYRSADAFALASREEPYGTVYGEAMALGVPVVGWAAGNLPNLAEHGREGLLAPAGDVPALAEALGRLAHDPRLRRRLGTAAARRAAGRPTWDETASLLFSALREQAPR